MTSNLSQIKSSVARLFNEHPQIHMDISFKSGKKRLTNVSAEITAVYPNVFAAAVSENNVRKLCTFQYADLLTRSIIIRELQP